MEKLLNLSQNQTLAFEEEEALKCPRCDSTNTKFCYYNNYNLSQPRHFCKSCRRYWTKGGALRNIPVGGGTRKGSKRATSAPKRQIKALHVATNEILENSVSNSVEAVQDNILLDMGVGFGNLLASNAHFGNATSASKGPTKTLHVASKDMLENNVSPVVEPVQDNILLDMGVGSFGNLLGNGHFGNFTVDGNFTLDVSSSVDSSNNEGIWTGHWPDLSIYTPGPSSTFH